MKAPLSPSLNVRNVMWLLAAMLFGGLVTGGFLLTSAFAR